MYTLLPTDEAAADAVGTGTFIINNTSYSGCDIKILVHMYDNNLDKAERLENVRKNIEAVQKRLAELEGELTKAKSRLAAEATNTPGYFIATFHRNRLLLEKLDLQSSLEAYENIAMKLPKQVNMNTKVLAEIQTLSLSIFRDKQAVRACGSVYPKSFTRGPREIAGSMIFTVFNEHVLYEFLQASSADFDGYHYTSAILDQLPPVDVTIAFANEYGQFSKQTIYGVEFLTEGQTLSIEDIITENAVNFVARDYDPMRSIGQRVMDITSGRLQQDLALKASDLILETDYKEYRDQISPFARFSQRRNPFV